MFACHAGGPGSIPGRCNSFASVSFCGFRKETATGFDLGDTIDRVLIIMVLNTEHLNKLKELRSVV